MRDTYSLYEAKARLSALVRRVREGARVIITVHGRPAAELRPLDMEDETIEARLDRLEALGALIQPHGTPAGLAGSPPGPRLRGGLQRFLDDRD